VATASGGCATAWSTVAVRGKLHSLTSSRTMHCSPSSLLENGGENFRGLNRNIDSINSLRPPVVWRSGSGQWILEKGD
jgi:hypothetical protein